MKQGDMQTLACDTRVKRLVLAHQITYLWFHGVDPMAHVLAGVEHFNNKSDFASHFLFHKVSMSDVSQNSSVSWQFFAVRSFLC